MDIWSALQARKRSNPGAPLVTYLSDAGQRVELSSTSVENAAAKIANALRGEFDLDHGSTVSLDLPLHWQLSVWLAGTWAAGCTIAFDDSDGDLTVVDEHTAATSSRPNGDVLAVSLHPFGLPIAATLPVGVVDATLAIRSQPDAYLFDPPLPSLAAISGVATTVTQEQVWQQARALAGAWGLTSDGRLLVRDDLDPMTALLACFAVPLTCDASVVLAVGDLDIEQVIKTERVTATAAPQQ